MDAERTDDDVSLGRGYCLLPCLAEYAVLFWALQGSEPLRLSPGDRQGSGTSLPETASLQDITNTSYTD